MERILYSSVTLVVIMAVVGCGCGGAGGDAVTVEEVFSKVAEMRQLTPKADVQYEFITVEELENRMIADFEEEYSEEEAAIDQEVFVLLDLMDESQNLRTLLLDLYCEQVAGFYDDESQVLYVVSEGEDIGVKEQLLIAHEYAHALQDQYYDLSSLPLEDEDNSDRSMAARSLIEGEASLLQSGYYLYELSESEQEAVQREYEELEMPKLEAAPMFIQTALLFPYQQGVEFVASLDGWESIEQAYEDLPQSTEQILHPEKYLDRDEPQSVTMPDLVSLLGGGWSQLDSDVLGELYTLVYLRAFLSESSAATAAEGWDGDRLAYLKKADGGKVLVLRSTWDGNTDAQEFFDAYIMFIDEKSGGNWNLQQEDSGKRQWTTDGQSVYLSQTAADILIIIAPDNDTIEDVLVGFPEF